jgi:A/G-specific adenine glycosylase
VPQLSSLSPTVIEWYRDNKRDLPWRRDGFGAWGILVSEFMLQQTPVARVIPRLDEWLTLWPTPAALAAASPGDAVRAWQSLGYPRRALALHACATIITGQHAGHVPDRVENLLAMPGIGDYTARAVAAFAHGQRHAVVDTNVRRVVARVVNGRAEAPPPRAKTDLAEMDSLLPDDAPSSVDFNAGMMELGAVICVARSPRCGACPIRHMCGWRTAGYPEHSGPRRAVQKRYEGSDRQVRGLLLAKLRASPTAVGRDQFTAVWDDAAQRDRALAGLFADGLVEQESDGKYALPG